MKVGLSTDQRSSLNPSILDKGTFEVGFIFQLNSLRICNVYSLYLYFDDISHLERCLNVEGLLLSVA